jgi:hypothetical protein
MATTAAALTPEYLFVHRDIARYDLIRCSVVATEAPKIRMTHQTLSVGREKAGI